FPGLSDLTALAGGSVVATTEVALLTSRTVVGSTVEQLQLDIGIQPKRFPLIGNAVARRFRGDSPDAVAPAPFGLHSYGWGGEHLQFQRLDVPAHLVNVPLSLEVADGTGSYIVRRTDDDELLRGRVGETAQKYDFVVVVAELRGNPGMVFEVKKRRYLDVVTALQQRIRASEQGKESGILQVSYEDTDPARAEAVVQKAIEAYVRQNVERSSAEAAAQLKFVKD